MRLRTRIFAGTAAALGVVIIIAAASWIGARVLVTTTRDVDETHGVVRGLDEVQAALSDVESGARGFALTGKDTYLEPFQRGEAAIGPIIARLRQLLRENPEQLVRLDNFEHLAAARVRSARETVEGRRAFGLFEAAARVETGEGKKYMDQSRAILGEMHAIEDEQLGRRLAAARDTAESARTIIAATAALLVVLVALWTRSLSAMITRPIAELVSATKRVARGEPARLDVVRHDEIGELTAAFAAMAEERDRIDAQVRDLVEHAADPMFIADRDGHLLDANTAACSLLGKPREALIGQRLVDLVAADDTQTVTAAEEALLESGAVDISQLRLKRSDGSLVPVETSSKIVSGNRWQILARDIRVRLAAEAERARILESERHGRRRLEAIRASALAISEIAPGRGAIGPTVLQAIVDQARQLTGADFAALGIGTDPEKPFEPWVWSGVSGDEVDGVPQRPRPRGLLGWVALRDDALRVADLAEHPSAEGLPEGHRQMSAFLGVPIRHHGKAVGNLYLTRHPGHGAFSEDDQAMLELLASHAAIAIENARLYDEVLAAVRTREELVAVVSHDLKNPLNAIAIHEQLLARTHADPELREHGQVVRRAVTAMQRMVRSLLDTASLDAGQLRLNVAEQPLDTVVDEVIDVFVPIAADRGVKLERELPPLPPVPVDRERIIQVLHNLVGNGLKHTREGAVTISAHRDNGEVQVTVADTGAGISPADLPHVFDRFFTTSRGHQGTGLGLHIARRLVEAHGGRIWAHSEPGAGTQMTFALPLSPKPRSPAPST